MEIDIEDKKGCGKSNVIEVLSSIFVGLYKNKLHKLNFDYRKQLE